MRRLALVLLLVAGCRKSGPNGTTKALVAPTSVVAVPSTPEQTQDASADRGPVQVTNPSKEACGAHLESDSCVFELADRAVGVGNRAKGISLDRARPAMEAARAKVFACVARVQPGSALGEELSHRVRIRASFDPSGKIERALFETKIQGYGYIDKHSHTCIVNALSQARLQPETRGEPVVVTYTYAFADGGT